jgi:hypothetical protein
MLLCGDNDLRMFARSYDHIPDLQAVTGPKIDLIGNIPEAVLLPLLFHGLSVAVCWDIHAGLSVAGGNKGTAGVIRVTSPLSRSVVVAVAIVFANLFRFSRSFFSDRQSKSHPLTLIQTDPACS